MNTFRYMLFAVAFLASAVFAQQKSADGEKVWSREQAYWQYVQTNNLDGYRTLWHAEFLGWPMSSAEPVRKDHITDWITAHTSKGETLKTYDLERRVIQITDNLATVTYRVRSTWVNKNGQGRPQTARILHTWVRGSSGEWQIISGMSASPNAEGR